MSVLSLSLCFWQAELIWDSECSEGHGQIPPCSNKLQIKICVSWTASRLSPNSSLRTPIRKGCASHPCSYPPWHCQRHSPHTHQEMWEMCPARAAHWPTISRSCRPSWLVVTTTTGWLGGAQAAESIILWSLTGVEGEVKCQNHREDRWGFEPTVYWERSKALKQSSSPAKHLAGT